MTATRIVLIRHAKTEQVGPAGLGDHGRRLLPRGESDARAAGAWLVEQGLIPDLVLCSSAARAQQTWEFMVAGDDALSQVTVWREPAIYEASPEDLIQAFSEVPTTALTVAMVGHAPGIPSLVVELADTQRADRGALAAFNGGYPTMGMAVLESASGIGIASMALTTMHTVRGS